MVDIDVAHISLGRPWLYDLDVTSFGRSNTYEFKFNRKRIVVQPAKPKSSVGSHKTATVIDKESKKPLRCLIVLKFFTVSPVAEFAYNNSVNKFIDLSPFEIVTGYEHRKPIDLLPIVIGPVPLLNYLLA